MMNQTASQRARASSLDASTLLILLAESSSLPAFGAAGHQVLAEFTVPSGQSNFTRALLLGLSAESQALELDGSAVTIVPLKAMIRESLACLNADVRREFGRFLCSVSGAFPHPSQTLHQSLHTLREALRERLPLVAPEPGQTRGLTVHNILAITDISFYVSGAVSDIAPLSRLTAVSPEGQRVELLQSASRFDPVGRGAAGVLDRDGEVREKPGFAAFFELPAPSLLTDGWLVECENFDGVGMEAGAPAAIRRLDQIRDHVLRDAAHDTSPDRLLITRTILPALECIQERHAAKTKAGEVLDFGKPGGSPDVSIIVPIYRRVDLMEHQILQFVRDPGLREAELIYVLDSPEDREGFLAMATQCHALYGLDFRVVLMNRNGGFSAANNAAAALARGRLLLLLNSDVLPDTPGWLRRLVAFHDANPRMGAVGPKLLYEDESLQHAGLFFWRADDRSPWNNEHYFKGLHRSLPAANIARAVPAVTAAALLMARELYLSVGGLSGAYVQGDFEDSDLCLRLWKAGKEIWYCPDVELYHLEGQSYPSSLRALTGLCNRWLHTLRHGDAIAGMAGRFAANPCES